MAKPLFHRAISPAPRSFLISRIAPGRPAEVWAPHDEPHHGLWRMGVAQVPLADRNARRPIADRPCGLKLGLELRVVDLLHRAFSCQGPIGWFPGGVQLGLPDLRFSAADVQPSTLVKCTPA